MTQSQDPPLIVALQARLNDKKGRHEANEKKSHPSQYIYSPQSPSLCILLRPLSDYFLDSHVETSAQERAFSVAKRVTASRPNLSGTNGGKLITLLLHATEKKFRSSFIPEIPSCVNYVSENCIFLLTSFDSAKLLQPQKTVDNPFLLSFTNQFTNALEEDIEELIKDDEAQIANDDSDVI